MTDLLHRMMHVGLGRAHPLHIDYVHLGICLAFIQDTMTEAILSHPKLPLQRKIGLVKALGKVIWIQNDLMAKWHVKDGDEFMDSEKEVVVEKEGYLHGENILDEVDEAEAEPSSPSRIPRPTCPFTGLSKDTSELGVATDQTHDERKPASPTATRTPEKTTSG